MNGNVCEDFFLKVADTVEDPSSNALLGDISKETLNHVEPGSARGREMAVSAVAFGQPGFHFSVFMGRVVVTNDMDFFRRVSIGS